MAQKGDYRGRIHTQRLNELYGLKRKKLRCKKCGKIIQTGNEFVSMDDKCYCNFRL